MIVCNYYDDFRAMMITMTISEQRRHTNIRVARSQNLNTAMTAMMLPMMTLMMTIVKMVIKVMMIMMMLKILIPEQRRHTNIRVARSQKGKTKQWPELGIGKVS